eukprot:TRINITY_DN11925_c0_g3_i1.p1 TRINITY_DN11925_c0_g3~~TRINITY_DN11925_c0_g3_i1.p1  ORF type:complete len:322 (+),score=67.77 TRINITY_DN11925_c0_g3_i1:78-1043(+)
MSEEWPRTESATSRPGILLPDGSFNEPAVEALLQERLRRIGDGDLRTAERVKSALLDAGIHIDESAQLWFAANGQGGSYSCAEAEDIAEAVIGAALASGGDTGDAPAAAHFAPPLPEVPPPPGMRPTCDGPPRLGDWPCAACNFTNWAARTACRRCMTPRGTAPACLGSRPGDWLCQSCGFSNYRRRERCKLCAAERVAAGLSLPAGGVWSLADLAAGAVGGPLSGTAPPPLPAAQLPSTKPNAGAKPCPPPRLPAEEADQLRQKAMAADYRAHVEGAKDLGRLLLERELRARLADAAQRRRRQDAAGSGARPQRERSRSR